MGWNHQLAKISQLSESKAPTVFFVAEQPRWWNFLNFFLRKCEIHFLHMFHTKSGHAFLPWDHLFIRVGLGVGNQPPHFSARTPLCCSMVVPVSSFGETTVNSTSNPKLLICICYMLPKRCQIENPNRYMMLPWQVFVIFLGWLSDLLERLSDLQLRDKRSHWITAIDIEALCRQFLCLSRLGHFHSGRCLDYFERFFCSDFSGGQHGGASLVREDEENEKMSISGHDGNCRCVNF